MPTRGRRCHICAGAGPTRAPGPRLGCASHADVDHRGGGPAEPPAAVLWRPSRGGPSLALRPTACGHAAHAPPVAVARGGAALARGRGGTGPRYGWHWPAVGVALARGRGGTRPRQGWHWPAAGMARLVQSRAAERQRLAAAHDDAMRANASLEAQVKELGTRRHRWGAVACRLAYDFDCIGSPLFALNAFVRAQAQPCSVRISQTRRSLLRPALALLGLFVCLFVCFLVCLLSCCFVCSSVRPVGPLVLRTPSFGASSSTRAHHDHVCVRARVVRFVRVVCVCVCVCVRVMCASCARVRARAWVSVCACGCASGMV
jgi:hypothetical protein